MTYAVDPSGEPARARWPGPITFCPAGPNPRTDPPLEADGARSPYGEPAYPPSDEALAGDAPPSPYAWGNVAKPPGRLNRALIEVGARAPRWLGPAAIALCFAGAAAVVLVSDPTDRGANQMETCLVKLTTGLDCPGCGATRALYYLLHGNIPQAARHHAVAVFAAPFLVWAYFAWAIARITGRQIPAPQLSARAVSIFLGVWAAFMVLRNLPWAPFTWFFV